MTFTECSERGGVDDLFALRFTSFRVFRACGV